ncbi:MAG: chemotaxis protein CheW [Candidatus Ozemobacteraceae bacterium]
MIASKNLDNLVNMIGDLITMQTRLNQLTAAHTDQEIIGIARGIEHLTSAMRDTTMHIRRMPIDTIFSRYRRLIRTLAEESGREFEFTLEGSDIELDKVVVEKLDKPLAELLRYAVLNDQELPEERESAGKSRKGDLRLSVGYRGGQALIRLSSDGRNTGTGADNGKGNRVGSEKDAEADLERIRGAIEEMRGMLDVFSSPTEGFVAEIIVPTTLAIYHGLQVTIGDRSFLLPLYSIQECVERDSRSVDETSGNGLILVRGETVPYLSLRRFLDIDSTPPDVEYIVIAAVDRRRIGFVVDKVVGELQTVIKPLGRFLRETKWFHGAAVLGDGKIVMIINIARVAAAAIRQQARSRIAKNS